MRDDVGARTALAPAPSVALGSDPHDFAGLYIRHRSSFTSHARRYLRDPRDADEVVQEAFLRLFLAMPELESELQALAYCRRTITNLCIDRYRADARRPRLVALEGAPVDELAEADTGDPVVRAEEASLVREALSQLPALHRAALVKREIEEKPLPVIAEELDVAEDSVKHLLFRARRSLRKLLAGTSVAPGTDAELTRGLRPLSRGASGGVAGLLLLALLGLGSGPDLRAVPVVGVDLPDVLGVGAVVDAVRDAVDAIVARDDGRADASGRELADRPVSRAGREPAAGAPAPTGAGERVAPPSLAATAATEGTSRRSAGAEPQSPSAGRTTTVVSVVDGRPVFTVVPRSAEPPPAPAPGTDVGVTPSGSSSGRGPAVVPPQPGAPLLPPPPVAPLRPTSGSGIPASAPVEPPLPTGGRSVRTAAPVEPVAPAAVPPAAVPPAVAQPARPSGAEAPGRPSRVDDAVQSAPDKAAGRAGDSAEKAEKAAERTAEKAERAAERTAEKADKATAKTGAAAERSQGKADRAEERATDKVERSQAKATENKAQAAADRAEQKSSAKAAVATARAAAQAAERAPAAPAGAAGHRAAVATSPVSAVAGTP